mmetsp:Transcript_35714/g.32183  ORF Transcript_35714/g.32183 Transcript_35714/m.32183 type:complete len:119 (-) Transcript_35714:274-630(-)
MLNICNALSKCSNEEIFKTRAVSSLVEYIWKNSRSYHYFYIFFFAVYMVMLTIGALDKTTGGWNDYVVMSMASLQMAYIILLFLVSVGHSKDIWNYLDFLNHLNIIFYITITPSILDD